MRTPCRTDSLDPADTGGVRALARSAAAVPSTHASSTSSVAPPSSAGTTPTGAPVAAPSSTCIAGASAASAPLRLITASPSRTVSLEAGPGTRSTPRATWMQSARAAIAAVLHSIKAVGVTRTVRLLLHPSRPHTGGGQTLLPQGHRWARHSGRAERRRHLTRRAQALRTSYAELDALEARYAKLRGQ